MRSRISLFAEDVETRELQGVSSDGIVSLGFLLAYLPDTCSLLPFGFPELSLALTSLLVLYTVTSPLR